MHYIFDREMEIVNKNLMRLCISTWIIPMFLNWSSVDHCDSISHVDVDAFIFHCDCRPLMRTATLPFQRPIQSQSPETWRDSIHKTSQTMYPRKVTALAGTVRIKTNCHKIFPKWQALLYINNENYHNHHHVHEELGVSCSLILKMKLVPPSLLWSSYVPSPFWSIM